MNFFKLYMGDYQRDTAHLSIIEHGAYLLMLQHLYATEKPLPAGKALYRLLRATEKEERDAIDSVLAQFWTLTDEGYINARAMDEIEKADVKRDQNREIGKRGGRPKITQKETQTVSGNNPEGNPNGFKKETQTVSGNNPEGNPNGFKKETQTVSKNSKKITQYQTPDTRHQTPEPDPRLQTPEPDLSDPHRDPEPECLCDPRIEDSGVATAPPVQPAVSAATWEAYATAYERRYGIQPVRNAPTNSQLKAFVQRIGAEDAPLVAAWFVGHNSDWYVRKGHSVAVMLTDAEKLRTEWATNRRTTSTAARQADRTQANGQVWQKLLQEAEAHEG